MGRLITRLAAPAARRRVTSLTLIAAFAALTALTVTTASVAARRSPSKAQPAVANLVTVTRDSAGIPHIVARTFTALGYGEGYVFAQDNLCTFANDVVTVEGDRSK
jgi:acyl-homoserine-lactone acylase